MELNKKFNLEDRTMPPTREQETTIAELVDKYINDHDVMIFSKSWCPFCKKVFGFSLTFDCIIFEMNV